MTHSGGRFGAPAADVTKHNDEVAPDWLPEGESPRPPARYGAGFVYDSQNNVRVLFGGIDSSGTYKNDTWTFCCAPFTWTVRSPATSPSMRAYPAMAFDDARNRVVLFGGKSSSGTALQDTYVWSSANNTWTPKSPATVPPARYAATMTYDPALSATIMYGGFNSAGTALQDVWEWDGSNWTRLTTSAGMGARGGGAITFDAALPLSQDPPAGQLLYFGGMSGSTSGTLKGDTWTSTDGVNWTQVATSGPTPRWGFGMDYDADAREVVLLGGVNGGTYYGDTWRYDGTQWTQASNVAAPDGLAWVQLAYDDDTNSQSGMVLGGYSATDGVLSRACQIVCVSA